MMKYIVLVLTLVLTALSSLAQIPFFQQYFLLKKNDPVQINAIFQEQSGIMLFGTNKGLFEFDGVRYSRMTTDNGLQDNNVTAICQDSVGRIWIGHKNGKISILENQKVTNFAPDEGTSTAEISDLLFDRHGRLWFSTFNDGLYYYKDNRLYRLDENEGMPDLFIYDIAEDADGNIWAGTDGGAAICSVKNNKTSVSVLNSASGAPDDIIKKIQFSLDGKAWLATEDAGVTIYDPMSRKFETLLPDDLLTGTTTDFIVDGDDVWISASTTGLIVYNTKTKQLRVYNESPAFGSIHTLLQDLEGNIWAGSKSGVFRSFGHEVELIKSFNGISNPNVLAVTADHSGRIWFSTREGLFVYDNTSGRSVIKKQLQNTRYENEVIISLYVDETGYVWAGLFGQGVLRINPRNSAVRLISQELRNGNILNITGKGNVVWLATLGGGTKITLDGEILDFKNYSSADGLASDYIYQVFIDSKDRVWFATDGKGIDMLDEHGFHHYQDGLPSRVVYGFAEDAQGMIWANVQANGIYYLEDNTFKSLPAGTKLRDNNILSFATTSDGLIAAMHESGIDVYDPVNKRIRQLGEVSGIHDNRPNLNSVAKDKHGRIYFGTEGGIVSYGNPNHRVFTTPTPILRNLRIFDKDIGLKPAPIFEHDENNLTISYQGIWYQNPTNLNYRHRLVNYDRDWIYTRDNEVIYSKLPPGGYTFELQVSDTDSFDHSKTATYSFIIEPPFWRTIPFYFIVAVLVIVLGWAILTYRERKLTRDKLILEAQVERRTAEIKRKNQEIQAQNDEILAQNEEIQSQAEEIKGINENLEQLVRDRTEEVLKKTKALEEYAFINAHKLRAPVASVLGLINLLEKTQLDADGKEINDHLKRSAEELDSIVYKITKTVERGM